MKCTECPCYVQHDTYDMYDNLMKEGDCKICYMDCYNNKTREFESCENTVCTFKVNGIING